ncbi:MAG: DUF1638 domain-containing protein [Desulfatitalea sp.]|nr:DUF1638 domain-containing protein [Desulfatitalea sp.]NNK01887.1 DUF1638 domain-containing protein [Desulfatitalea sp.]
MNKTIPIIACSVFKDAIAYLKDWMADRPFAFSYLPSHLHLKPADLKRQLMAAIRQSKRHAPCMGCLYGQCFADIDHQLTLAEVLRIPCGHCYEVLLGPQRYRQIVSDHPGTFFVEKELLLDFDTLCREPLALDDPEMRELFFLHYRQVVYIRQPLDPDLTAPARHVADLLGLALRVEDADYEELKRFLIELQRC